MINNDLQSRIFKITMLNRLKVQREVSTLK